MSRFGITFQQINAAEVSGHFTKAEIQMMREHVYEVGERYHRGIMIALDESTPERRLALSKADPESYEAWESLRSGDLVERVRRASL